MLIKIPTFTGEVPRLPTQLLPDNAAEVAINCDFLHGELRGHLDWTLKSVLPQYTGAPIVSVWSYDGTDFFGWPFETTVVKSPVIADSQSRIYYAAVPTTGPTLKVARTQVLAGPKVINSMVRNFWPPESASQAWLLGVPAPWAQGVAIDDLPALSLYDLAFWPTRPNLQLQSTYFLEDKTGAIVWERDISNTELATTAATGATNPGVYYTNDSSLRGNMVQDMLWPLGWVPRPFKYYWFDPPSIDSVALTRTVTVTNASSTGNPIVITYGASQPTPTAPNTGYDPSTSGGEA